MRHLLQTTLVVALLTLPSTGRPAAPARRSTAALAASLQERLSHGPLAGARIGACVVSLDTGATLLEHDADVLLNPASTVKLATTAAALSRLGPAYRFRTEVLVEPGQSGRAAVPALHLRGTGDPTLTTERLYALAAEIRHAGVARVGDLVLDEGWFDGERIGAGFDQEDGDRAYLAPAGALSLNFNAVAIHVAPGAQAGQPARIELEPDSAYFQLVNRVKTVGPEGRARVRTSAVMAGGRQRIVVEGRVPAGGRRLAVWRKVDDPPRYLVATLRRLLELQGVKVTGGVRLAPVPAGARLLAVSESEELSQVVLRLNKSSSNFMAEQLVKALGAEVAGPPGSWASGLAAIEEELAGLGLPRGAYVMRNGSGLNDANRFSARQLVTLLSAAWRRFPMAPEYLSSLPVAARDGTIRRRLEGSGAEGRLRAKTGTLQGVTALAGYVETAEGERLAFAFLVNDHRSRGGLAAREVDRLAAQLAGRLPAEPPALADRAALEPALGSYLAMARDADPRNCDFLRRALLTETDPLVRLAAAEALYRSQPDEEASGRALLDAAAAIAGGGGEAGRAALAAALLRLAEDAGAGQPAPALAALGDLAAFGSAEALARLLDLAPAADGALAAPYATALGETGAAAPEELVAALAAAPAPVLDGAVASLRAFLAARRADDQPLMTLLEAWGAGRPWPDDPAGRPPSEAEVAEARALLARLSGGVSEPRGKVPPSLTTPAGDAGHTNGGQ